MDLKRLSIEYHKIRNLKQYARLPDEEKRRLAYSRAIEHHLDLNSLFITTSDRTSGKSLAKKYLEDYTPETISDINTLRSIIFLEVLNDKLQKGIDKTLDPKAVETIHKNLNQILVLKEALGLTGKKSGNVKSLEHKLSLMRKQFQVWLENNQASREAVCPYCAQHFLLHVNMAHWEEQRHPFFKDRILWNETITKLYLEKRLSKDEVAKILECSVDYIDWVIERLWKRHPEYDRLLEETGNQPRTEEEKEEVKKIEELKILFDQSIKDEPFTTKSEELEINIEEPAINDTTDQ